MIVLLAQEENRLAFELIVGAIAAFGLCVVLPVMALYLFMR